VRGEKIGDVPLCGAVSDTASSPRRTTNGDGAAVGAKARRKLRIATLLFFFYEFRRRAQ